VNSGNGLAQQPSKMWSGRFREPLDSRFEAWQRSFPFDWRLIQAEVSASMAHARMLGAAGILTSEEQERMIAGLRGVGAERLSTERELNDPEAPFAASVAQAEDVHHFVELELTREIGDLALKLHTGRSRNEQIATDMRLYVIHTIGLTIDWQRQWALALIALAQQASDSIMPSYTHLQRAEPVLASAGLQDEDESLSTRFGRDCWCNIGT